MSSHTVTLQGTAMMVSSSSATLSVHSPLPIGHPLLGIIGHIVNQWSHVDRFLRLAIFEVSGEMVSTKDHTKNLCQRLIAEAKRKKLSDATLEKITEFDASIQERTEKRNRVVHDPWYSEKTTGALGQSILFSFAISESDGEALKAVSNDAEAAFREANGLRGVIWNELHM